MDRGWSGRRLGAGVLSAGLVLAVLPLPAMAATPMCAPDPGAPARLSAMLEASGDPYVQALAEWLRPNSADAGSPVLLAHAAAGSADPRLYALAFTECTHSREPACATLSAGRWREVDPGNGLPALWQLEAAQRAADLLGTTAALEALSSADRYAERRFTPVESILRTVGGIPREDGGLAALDALATASIGSNAATVLPLGALNQACSTVAVVDPARRATCLRIAQRMTSSADTLDIALVGVTLESRISGETSRRDAIAHDYERMSTAVPAANDCSGLRARLAYDEQAARWGEPAAARSGR